MSVARRFALAFLQGVLTVILLHIVNGDYIVLRSDWASLTIYLTAAALILALFFFLASYLFRIFNRRAQAIFTRAFLIVVQLELFLTMIAVVGGSFKISKLLGPYRGHLGDETIALLRLLTNPVVLAISILVLVILIVVLALARRKPTTRRADTGDTRRRIEQVGLAALLASAVFVPLAFASLQLYGPTRDADGVTDPRLLVLVILDGFPANLLPVYNSEAKSNALDHAFRRGRVLRNLRTVRPYTAGYFGTLYDGRLTPLEDGDNLVSSLQNAGVEVRLMSFHRNGMPDGSTAQSSNYLGLRSILLNPEMAWVPRMLGIPHHLFLASHYYWKQSLVGRLLSPYIPGEEQVPSTAFRTLLLPEIAALARRSDRGFLLFHMAHTAFGADLQATATPLAAGAIQEILDNDYRYGPEHAELARAMRLAEATRMETIGREVVALLESLKRLGLSRKVATIVTSDHGSIFDKGRFWYTFHPNEEVVRVPGVIFQADAAGVDDRLFDTVDLSASIRDYFSAAPISGGEETHSFFSTDSGRRWSGTLTGTSDKSREWFLVLVNSEGRKYQLNIHPESAGGIEVIAPDGFADTVVERWPAVPDELWPVVSSFLARFDLADAEIHANYRGRTGK